MRLRHQVVILNTVAQTIGVHKFRNGKEWTFDFSEAEKACGKLNSQYLNTPFGDDNIGGFEIVSEQVR